MPSFVRQNDAANVPVDECLPSRRCGWFATPNWTIFKKASMLRTSNLTRAILPTLAGNLTHACGESYITHLRACVKYTHDALCAAANVTTTVLKCAASRIVWSPLSYNTRTRMRSRRVCMVFAPLNPYLLSDFRQYRCPRGCKNTIRVGRYNRNE